MKMKKMILKIIEKFLTQDELEYIPIKNIKKLNKKINCYDLQVEDVHSFIGNGIVNHNTTIMYAFIRFCNLTTLILVNKVMLGSQLRDGFKKDGIDCGLCSGNGVIEGKCMVSTIQSVKKLGDLTRFKVVLVDECFHGNTKILTENGYKSIYYLANNKSTAKVFSFNKETTTVDLKQITN